MQNLTSSALASLPEFLTPEEAAPILGVGAEAVRIAIRAKRLAAYQSANHRYRIPRAAIREFLGIPHSDTERSGASE